MGMSSPPKGLQHQERRRGDNFINSSPLPKTALLNPLSPQTSKLPSTSEAPWRPPVPRVGRSSKGPGGGGEGGLSQPLESPEGRRYSPLPGTQPQTSLLASCRGNGNSAPPTASRSLLPVSPRPPGSQSRNGERGFLQARAPKGNGGEDALRVSTPRFQGSPAPGKKRCTGRCNCLGETPALPPQGPLPALLPARAPSRRGARDLPSGIPERKKAQ